jgi:hypothetical protein
MRKMTGIFVDDSDTIDVTVCYKIGEGNKIDISESDKPAKDEQSLTVKFARPDFATSQRLLQASTYTSPSGEQNVNFVQMQSNLLYVLAKDWDVKDKDGKKVELNSNSISKLRIEIAKALIFGLVNKIGSVL